MHRKSYERAAISTLLIMGNWIDRREEVLLKFAMRQRGSKSVQLAGSSTSVGLGAFRGRRRDRTFHF